MKDYKLYIKQHLAIIAALILCLTSFGSCKKLVYSIRLERMIGKQLTITDDYLFVKGTNPYYQFDKSDVKVVLWFSPKECSTCRLSGLSNYRQLEDFCRDSVKNVGVMYIFSPSEEKRELFEEVIENTTRDASIFVDYDNKFGSSNKFLSSEEELHCFLLDSENKIVLVGNPMLSNSVFNLYKNKLKELSTLAKD